MLTFHAQIFGYGNHIWPRSRISAGLCVLSISFLLTSAAPHLTLRFSLVVSSWAKNLGLEFKRNELLQYDIAEAPRILFARPTCYLPENRYKYIKRLLNQYSLTPKELVLVYPDENVRVRCLCRCRECLCCVLGLIPSADGSMEGS